MPEVIVMAKKGIGMKESAKCVCGPKNVVWMLVAVVIFAVGFWVLIEGLQAQWGSGSGNANWLTLLVWYAVAFLVLWIGKLCKWKSMSCPVHGHHC